MQHEYSMLKGERIDEEGATYLLRGLEAGRDFRDSDEYSRLTACWLKVEGVGFSAPAFEFSQHGKRVVVEQESEGGSAHIRFEDE